MVELATPNSGTVLVGVAFSVFQTPMFCTTASRAVPVDSMAVATDIALPPPAVESWMVPRTSPVALVAGDVVAGATKPRLVGIWQPFQNTWICSHSSARYGNTNTSPMPSVAVCAAAAVPQVIEVMCLNAFLPKNEVAARLALAMVISSDIGCFQTS